jgi:hypothetical protein
LPKSPGKKFTKSPGNVFAKSPHKITKSPHNLNTYRSPDLKRRRGWRNKPPTPYKNMTHAKVETREEYAHMESAGYVECQTTIEEPIQIIHEIEHIDDNDNTSLS